MQRSWKLAAGPAVAIAAAGGLIAATTTLGSSCGGESVPAQTSGGTPGASGSSSGSSSSSSSGDSVQSFAPRGCSFSIATRPEYQEFAPGKPVSGATPNIRRVRLGLGGNVALGAAGRADPSTSIAFAWQTDDGTLASDVRWGTDPDPAQWPADNRAQGVTWLTPPGAINGAGPERMHEAYVCGLKPATTYYYRVGGGPEGRETWSDVFRFTTTPSDPGATVKIAVTGDSRGETNDAWRLLQRQVRLAGVGLQLFSGDAVSLATDQGEWEKWLDVASRDVDNTPMSLAEILMLTAHGNHENHSSLFFGNLVLPQDQAKYARYAELFFSVDVGPVHIVVVDDAWIAYPTEDPGYQGVLTSWLHEDLSAAVKNRQNVPWIITVQHRSEFSSSSHGKDADVLRVREYFVPLWDQYHVDLALRGHDHNYERTKPLTGPASNPTVRTSPAEGTVYVVCAGAGAPAYAPGTSSFTEVSHGFQNNGAIGVYGILTASRAELKLEARELRPDKTDPIFDTLTITK
jgi:acid phosphatase type 7